jgi:Fe-S-cluster containining protein
MKLISEKQALLKLRKLKNDFREFVKQNYEHHAKSCETCKTKGVCCLDEHFVNVHITRLEAVLIAEEIAKLTSEKQKTLSGRIAETIEKYNLSDEGDTFEKTFACPLFEKEVGCLIHSVKPVPCIMHACYERREEIPPDELQTEIEEKIEKLNRQTYRNFPQWLPLPIFLELVKKD